MFICDNCLKEHYVNQPSIVRSKGPCEICHAVAICSDIPSKYLQKQQKLYPYKVD